MEPYVREYEGQALLGPHSITLSKDGMVFFTDAGPMGETGLSNPKGSVFAIQGSARALPVARMVREPFAGPESALKPLLGSSGSRGEQVHAAPDPADAALARLARGHRAVAGGDVPLRRGDGEEPRAHAGTRRQHQGDNRRGEIPVVGEMTPFFFRSKRNAIRIPEASHRKLKAPHRHEREQAPHECFR